MRNIDKLRLKAAIADLHRIVEGQTEDVVTALDEVIYDLTMASDDLRETS